MPAFDVNGRNLVVAMDHARAMGAVPGLEDPGRVIDTVIEAGADAIMTSYGVVKRYRERLVGQVPTFLRIDGGPSLLREKWLENSAWTLLHSIEDANELGVDGVCVMAFIGAECELDTLEIVAEVAGECMRAALPVMVEALPCPHPNIPDPTDADRMADACRIGFEHGADVLKTYYTGSVDGFRKVIDNCPAPVLIAGGPKMDSDRAVFDMVAGTIGAGGKGVVFGRNIWQSANPAGMVKALRNVIHDGGDGASAEEIFKSA